MRNRISIGIINIYVLIFSLLPFFIGIGYSIYTSQNKRYLSTVINISGSQRMRTMLLSNYSQQLHHAAVVGDGRDNIDPVSLIIENEMRNYGQITAALRYGNAELNIGQNHFLETIQVIDDLEFAVRKYIESCELLLEAPEINENLQPITSMAVFLRDRFDLLTSLFQRANDRLIRRQWIIDISMIIFAFLVTVYGLIMTRSIFRQESELKQAKKEAERLATHDALTGLPNRRLLQDRVDTSILLAKRNKMKIAVCMMDMDAFKSVNDTYGHLTGDELLKETARRFREVLREHDSIYRLGGDEFVCLLVNLPAKEECGHIVQRMLNRVRQPFILPETVLKPAFSMGVAFYPDDGETFGDLIRNADLALYRAKVKGKGRFSYFGEE